MIVEQVETIEIDHSTNKLKSQNIVGLYGQKKRITVKMHLDDS